MHSRFCRHAVGAPGRVCPGGRGEGHLRDLLHPAHSPPGFRPGFWNGRLRMDEGEFDSYLEELQKARSAFPDLVILSGVEADYIPSRESWLARFLSEHSFDFVLMSTHYVSTWDEDEWVFDFHEGRPLPSVYHDYFREMRAGIETGLFDCVAHLDLIKQPGSPVLATNRDDVEMTLAACSEQGMSVEINTSGLRKEIAETYPCNEIIDLMIQRDISLVTGSDAHAPAQIGLGFEQLMVRHAPLSRRLVRYRGRDRKRFRRGPPRPLRPGVDPVVNLPGTGLPLVPFLPEISSALEARHVLALVAEPGAGKSTLVPPFLLEASWLAGRRILMLEPRRLAAVAIAGRIAELLGEEVGRRAGYRVRAASRVSGETRIEVLTEALLTRKVQQDPAPFGGGTGDH